MRNGSSFHISCMSVHTPDTSFVHASHCSTCISHLSYDLLGLLSSQLPFCPDGILTFCACRFALTKFTSLLSPISFKLDSVTSFALHFWSFLSSISSGSCRRHVFTLKLCIPITTLSHRISSRVTFPNIYGNSLFKERSLGQLEYLRIWHDNSGKGPNASWYLCYIVFRDVQTGEKWEFIANRWFAIEKDDGQLMHPHTLFP
ncbi:hypothetical protein SK128_004765 [Halocaridina rubra]|uniref:PLAT domain-containing protein n=1 Tax=Halocaridina rubra TaxID=373956 RepID=A0AAN8WHB2_HALRR